MGVEGQRFQQFLKAEFIRPEMTIPGMPEVGLRVVRRLADISATVPQVAKLVASDPALAGVLLRNANSIDYNPSAEPTTDLSIAVRRIGFDSVRRLTLAYALQTVRDAPRYRIVHGRLAAMWQRSVALASLARVMSAHISGVPRERANTAGLLHTVGHIWVIAKAASSPGVLQDPMHLENLINDWRIPAARRLLQSWGMDPEFVDSVCDHESADEATGAVPALTDLLYVCQLFHAYKDSPLELTKRLAASPASARLGLRGRERELVFSHSADEIRAVRSALCD